MPRWGLTKSVLTFRFPESHPTPPKMVPTQKNTPTCLLFFQLVGGFRLQLPKIISTRTPGCNEICNHYIDDIELYPIFPCVVLEFAEPILEGHGFAGSTAHATTPSAEPADVLAVGKVLSCGVKGKLRDNQS